LHKVPEGVTLRDAVEILPEQEIFQHVNGSWAPFSDWFRFALLYKEGGLWVDTDIICLKPFTVPDNTICGEEHGKPSIGFIAMQKGHALAKELMLACEDPRTAPLYDNIVRQIVHSIMINLSKEEARRRAPWSYSGNDMLQQEFKKYSWCELPPCDVYPIKYPDALNIVNGVATLEQIKDAKCVHLWRSVLRRRDPQFADSCLYTQLKQLTLD
jgi:hypothetical protein